MKRSNLLLSFALAFAFSAALAAPPALADRGSGLRSIRSGGGGHSIGRALGSIGRSHGSSRGSRGLEGLGRLFDGGRHGSRGSRGLEGLGDLLGRGGYGGWGDRGDRFGRGYGDWFGRDRHRHDNDWADAYRDAAIADAVVGITGIIAGAAMAPYGYGQPVYPAPAPVYVAPPPPRYRTERVLVREGYYEQQDVWVPEFYDRRTGETVRGHYETRQRWVPEVWEERQVQVYP